MSATGTGDGPRLPWFRFFVQDFLTDRAVQLMSLEERGLYVTLMCLYWLEPPLPLNPLELGRLCNADPELVEHVLTSEGGRRLFEVGADDGIHHVWLRGERERAMNEYLAKSRGGKEGARRRWSGV